MDKIRAEIDEIDDAMRILFEKRLACVEKVIDYKLKNQIEILDSNREAMMIEKNLSKLNNLEYQEAYTRFLREVIEGSKEFQQRWLDQKRGE